MRRVYDVSLAVTDGGVVYPGNPATRFAPRQAIARGDAANLTAISLGSHTATHGDAARHFIDGGANVHEIPLDRLIGPAVVGPSIRV